jgi:mRNA interferase RelE/StbE
MRAGSRMIMVPASVAGLVRGLHPDLKRKVRSAFEELQADPFAGKKLKDELAGLWSFRVGRHRIIYRLRGNDQVEIVAVGPREGIYEDTYRLIRKRER